MDLPRMDGLTVIEKLWQENVHGFHAPTVLTVNDPELNRAGKVAYRDNRRIKLTVRGFPRKLIHTAAGTGYLLRAELPLTIQTKNPYP